MRRLFRILFNALTVLSLVLAILLTTAWFGTYRDHQTIAKVGTPGALLESHHGKLQFHIFRSHPASRPLEWLSGLESQLFISSGTGYQYRGYRYRPERGVIVTWQTGTRQYSPFGARAGQTTDVPYLMITGPHWAALCASLLLPLLAGLYAIGRYRNSQRATGNLCPSCGYDLRATPEQCPECGAVPTAVSA